MTLLCLLFKYHAPSLYCFLESNFITIEMYAIPWFITYFSTKMDTPELVLQFWNKVASQKYDQTYIFFFALALVLSNEQKIKSCDMAALPSLMASLRIRDEAELNMVFKMVEQLEENTPYSFIQLPEL